MKKNGFTLLEILISVGILAIVSTLIVQVLFTTTHVNKKSELLVKIKQNGNFVLDVVGRKVRAASALETTCDVGATSTPSARIRGFDDTLTVITCLSDGNVARIASVTDTETLYLSDAQVTVSLSGSTDCSGSTLEFSCPAASGGIQSELTVSFTLRQPGSAGSLYESQSASFQSTIGLRK